ILPSRASRAWRGRYALRWRSTRARRARCPRPKASWAADPSAPGRRLMMTIYTVHEPRPRRNEDAAPPERYTFVRDGFYFWAFLFGPLWMLWHRLWLVLFLYVIGIGAVTA